MSLNKFNDYDKYEILNGQLKAKKLGLKDATNNKCCFISNSGEKDIISRDIIPSDLPTGAGGYGTNVTVYQQLTDKINIVNTADAVVPIFNDINAVGSRTVDCTEFQVGDYIECNSSGFHTTRQGQSEILRGLNLKISDGINSQTWEIYTPPETNTRYGILFPTSVANFNQSLWDLNIKFIKNDFDAISNNCKVFVKFNSQTNAPNEGSGSAIFNKFSTVGIDWNGTVSVTWSWKYSTSPDLSPSFQIYTLDSTVKRVFRIQSA
jgi:hypothetical protein